MIAALETCLLESWEGLDAGPQPRRIHVAKLSHDDYPPPSAPILFLLFADRATRPAAVAKVARIAAGDALIERERHSLERVRSLLPADLRDAVPRVLRNGAINGRSYVLMTALGGEVEMHHTWDLRHARRATSRMAAAFDWIRQAGQATAGGDVRGAEWLRVTPEAAFAELARIGCDPALLRRHRDRLAALWTASWPCGLSHGDYFPGNLLFERRATVRVVDWMYAEPHAPLFCDPMTYELSFLVHALRAGWTLTRSMVDAVRAHPGLAAEAARWREAGMDVEAAGAARLATLVHAALRDGAADAGRGPIGTTWARLLDWHLENT